MQPWIDRAEKYRKQNIVRKHKNISIGKLSVRLKYPGEQEWTDLGVVSEAVITQGMIAQLVAVLQGGSATTLQSFHYHASGTGTQAEANTNTALFNEVETREIGTQTSIGAGNYRTVATHTYVGEFAITEHGLFSAITGGVLFDRSKFAPILTFADLEVEFTYDLTIVGA